MARLIRIPDSEKKLYIYIYIYIDEIYPNSIYLLILI